MKLGLGLGLGSGNSLPRYVTDYFNGFELSGSTYTGGPTVVADNTGVLVTSPAGVLPIEGMRLATTVAEGAVLGPELATAAVQNLTTLVTWSTHSSAVVNDFNTFTTTEAGGVRLNGVVSVGKRYLVTVVIGSTTSCEVKSNFTGAGLDVITSVSGAFEFLANSAYLYIRNNGAGVTDFQITSLREVIPTWLPTTSLGAQIHPSTPLRTRKGTVSVYGEDFKGPLIEPPRTNLAIQSNRFDITPGGWGALKGFVFDGNVTSILPGVSAQKLTNDGTGSSRNRSQTLGTFSGATDTAWFIVENVDSVETSVGIYDSTAASWVVSGLLTWETEAAAIIRGSGTIFSEKLSNSGPNGGKVFLLGVAGASTSGNTRAVFLYPQGRGISTKSLIIHHGQFEAAASFPSSPILTAATTVTRPAANLTRPTAGTALAALNNWAIRARFRPTAAGQTAVLWGSYTDADNATRLDLAPTTLTYTKRLAGADHVAQASLTHAADTLYEALIYQHSVHGMGITTRSWSGSAWSAWSTWVDLTDANGIANASIAATYQNGAVNNSIHVCANLPFIEVITVPASVNPQTWLMSQLALGRI